MTRLGRAAALSLLLFSTTACFSKYTGNTGSITTQTDRSDPVRAALADALDAADENFASLITTPFDEAERKAMIDRTVSLEVMSAGQSKMDLLRAAEALADSAKHVSTQLEGASAHYTSQNVVTSGATSVQQFLTWTYDVPFEQRASVASDLVARIAPMFAGGRNWNKTEVYDETVNPYFGQTTYSAMTDIGLDASSTMIIIEVTYAHNEVNHGALGGVMLRVMKMTTKVD